MPNRRLEAQLSRLVQRLTPVRVEAQDPSLLKVELTLSATVLITLLTAALFHIGYMNARFYHAYAGIPIAFIESDTFVDNVVRGLHSFLTIVGANEYSKRYEGVVYVRIFYGCAMAFFALAPIYMYRHTKQKPAPNAGIWQHLAVPLAIAAVGGVTILSYFGISQGTAMLSAEVHNQSLLSRLRPIRFAFVPGDAMPKITDGALDLEAENRSGRLRLVQHVKDGFFVLVDPLGPRRRPKQRICFVDAKRVAYYELERGSCEQEAEL